MSPIDFALWHIAEELSEGIILVIVAVVVFVVITLLKNFFEGGQ